MDTSDFEKSIIIQLEKLVGATETLAKQVDKLSREIFGNGEIKDSIVWKMAETQDCIKEIKEDIKFVKTSLKDGETIFNNLENNFENVSNLKVLNKFIGLFGNKWFRRSVIISVLSFVFFIYPTILPFLQSHSLIEILGPTLLKLLSTFFA